MILRIVTIFFISQIFTAGAINANESNLFSIDKWEGAGGDNLYYNIHLDIKQPKVKVTCRLYDEYGGLITGESWSFYEAGWENRLIRNDNRTVATEIKCRGNTF
jgi:hypothetical protein